jgi:hypothetical protein
MTRLIYEEGLTVYVKNGNEQNECLKVRGLFGVEEMGPIYSRLRSLNKFEKGAGFEIMWVGGLTFSETFRFPVVNVCKELPFFHNWDR